MTAQSGLVRRVVALVVIGAAITYAAGYFFEYSVSALGLVPVLDGREMLLLARAIAHDQLPNEPFYRAMVYPALLSTIVDLGGNPGSDIFAARLLNFVLHLVNAVLVGALSWQLWRHQIFAFGCAILWCVYPVALYFAVDLLDITLAITFLLAGLVLSIKWIRDEPSNHRLLLIASIALGLAAGTRPQLLAVLLAWVMAMAWLGCGRSSGLRVGLSAATPAILIIMSIGAVNFAYGGEFRMLPWQGAYDLWSANRSGAHGAYYEQERPLLSYQPGRNPARAESEAKFVEENPGVDATIGNMTAYWQRRLFDGVVSEPLLWVSLLGRKIGFLLNNFEQYNNKTFSFHKARSQWLVRNPLCWALLLAGACAGLVCAWRGAQVRFLVFVSLVFAGALGISYVSARFRLPLAPILLVMSGGLVTAESRKDLLRALLVALAVAAVSFYPLPLEWRERTYIQDELLIAKAAAEAGLARESIEAADAAHRRDPRHAMALELRCISRFNVWLYELDDDRNLLSLARVCEQATSVSEVARRVTGHLAWVTGNQREALSLWRALLAGDSSEREAALAALIHSGAVKPDSVALNWSYPDGISTRLLLALADVGDTRAAGLVEQRMQREELNRQQRAIRKLFPRTAP